MINHCLIQGIGKLLVKYSCLNTNFIHVKSKKFRKSGFSEFYGINFFYIFKVV